MVGGKPFDLSQLSELSLSLVGNTRGPTRPILPVTRKILKTPYAEMDPLEILGEKGFVEQKPVSVDLIGTPIQEFFRGTRVLITGGTGYLGKVLIDKLIRSNPHLGQIYLLIRSKRGKSAQERFETLLKNQVFLRMRTEVPDYRSKISVVDGDISKPGLGLSEADLQLLSDRINVIFHSAADVRFIEPLRVAVESNVYGGRRILDLAKGMKNLKSYVHVSTAYSYCVQRIIKEDVPKMSLRREEILHILESKTDEQLEGDLKRIMQEWPNTYAFSKALCEDLIRDECEGLPVCIFRPSVVGPSYKDPVRGWTDNVNGPFGLLLGIALGVIHCFWTNDELILDIVPVDYAVNGMIAAAWQTASWSASNLLVYNFTALSEHRVDWKTFKKYDQLYVDQWPYLQAVWYNSFFFVNSSFIDKVCHLFLHKIPGFFFDKLAVLSGQQPRLMRIYEKIDAVKPQMHYFSFSVWEFENSNLVNLRNTMSKEDKCLFNFDVRDINQEEYFVVGKIGLRYYYLKEKMETIAAAKQRNMWLYLVHNTLKLVTGLVVLKLLVLTAHVLPI